jgi:hypothetical protein
MFSFHENLGKWRTSKSNGIQRDRLPWPIAIPGIAVLSLLGWILVFALASVVASIL